MVPDSSLLASLGQGPHYGSALYQLLSTQWVEVHNQSQPLTEGLNSSWHCPFWIKWYYNSTTLSLGTSNDVIVFTGISSTFETCLVLADGESLLALRQQTSNPGTVFGNTGKLGRWDLGQGPTYADDGSSSHGIFHSNQIKSHLLKSHLWTVVRFELEVNSCRVERSRILIEKFFMQHCRHLCSCCVQHTDYWLDLTLHNRDRFYRQYSILQLKASLPSMATGLISRCDANHQGPILNSFVANCLSK